MQQDEKVVAATLAMQEIRGEYRPLTRLTCIVIALLEVHREAPLLDASLSRGERIASLTQCAVRAILHERAKG